MTVSGLRVIELTAVLPLMPESSIVLANRAEVWPQHLSFRWTSGDPIRTDVIHPQPAALQNPPFLIDPDIVSAVVEHGTTMLIIKYLPDELRKP